MARLWFCRKMMMGYWYERPKCLGVLEDGTAFTPPGHEDCGWKWMSVEHPTSK